MQSSTKKALGPGWQDANNTFPESYTVKDYENVKLVYLPLCKAAQLSLILCMISKNSDFG